MTRVFEKNNLDWNIFFVKTCFCCLFSRKFLKTFVWIGLLIKSNAYPLSTVRGGDRNIHNGGSSNNGNSPKGCRFPFENPELAAVTSDGNIFGWALGAGPTCLPGSHCTYFCRSGYFAQPSSKVDFSSGFSEGRVFCDESGNLQIPSGSLCVAAPQNIYVLNLFDTSASYCQESFSNGIFQLASNYVPGHSFSTIAVPSHVGSRSSSYYFNPPGSGNDLCTIGSRFSNQGAWSPYTLELSSDYKGDLYLRLGWNPRYTHDSYWKGVSPNWGIRLDCEGPSCDHSPCFIDPSIHNVNECENAQHGYSDAVFCGIKLSARSRARVVLFSKDNVNDEQRFLSALPRFDFEDASDDTSLTEKAHVPESQHEEYKSTVDDTKVSEHHESHEEKTKDEQKSEDKQGSEKSEHTNDKIDNSEHSQTSKSDNPENKKSTFIDSLSKIDFSSITNLEQSSSGSDFNKYISKSSDITLMLFHLEGSKNQHMHASGLSCPLSNHDNANSLSANSPDSVLDDCGPTHGLLFLSKPVNSGYKLLADKFENYMSRISLLIRDGNFQTLEFDIPKNTEESSPANNGTNHENSAYIMRNNILWTLITVLGIIIFL
ncbi:uncharacterized protein T551_01051 [Pneumocystis jirovecii RU7]|uniref:Uncharacterized protein n=1 Tax=Pneumocystis jirovecii (strain RU7) TaxID=1408657 RepID=A0A0W4ZTR4_PNEJ7|nr:uncharacterized protein T551_01051 [Pneumocystis jirovecii RU7]KTW31790.1 hypothetical protein T551_01051 [Pneumocystis jirovecii RU7]